MTRTSAGRLASRGTFAASKSGAGILLFSAGVFFFALTDAAVKWLVADYGVGQIVFIRALGAGIILVPLLWRQRKRELTGSWRLHALRVGCMAADTFSFYFATRALPLADVMTFYLAAPLFVTALAIPLLGERVGALRWAAVVAGFVGVVIALRPGTTALSASALIALFGSIMFALALTITRKLRGTHWMTLVALFFAGSGIVGGLAAPFAWTRPSAFDLTLMLAIGMSAMVCFACITKALTIAPASVLAPFQYASIVWAGVLGWTIWGDVPSTAVAIGSALIVASGMVVVYDERPAGEKVSIVPEPTP